MCQRAHRLLVAFLLVSLAASVSARADPITVTFTAFRATGDPLKHRSVDGNIYVRKQSARVRVKSSRRGGILRGSQHSPRSGANP